MKQNGSIATVPKNVPPVGKPAIPESEWVEIVEITPEIAEKWLHDYSYHGQRPIVKGQVDFLAFEMAAGRFETSEMRLVHVGDRIFLTNGQHRLRAVIAS